MSDLLRSLPNHETPLQPPPRPVMVSSLEEEEEDRRPSSDSSASSTASAITVRPGSRECALTRSLTGSHWTDYFAQELYLDYHSDDYDAKYHVYVTPPTDLKKGPLFVCHHGAGASGLSFACFAREVQKMLPGCGVLSLEAREHGSSIMRKVDITGTNPTLDFSIVALSSDALNMIHLTKTRLEWPVLPPMVLVGHSLGGAVVTEIAANGSLGVALIGFAVLDVVEGSALEALAHMRTYLSSRPDSFATVDAAVEWHVRSRTVRNVESARVSVPSLLVWDPSPSSGAAEGVWRWRTELKATEPWWEVWFKGMSAKFLRGKGAKMLVLAGTDRLDKDLMIGQMQGKFQLHVLPEAGHFVQEDMPERTAQIMVDFFKRNDRSAMILPPKVSDLLAQGKKV
ncbi:Protein phosphatase methylesterase 1 [Elasticomyces elasticus]|nr:hypothetical protein LTR28_011740 [Elasticomyces elasticus]KAK4983990.1 Protein phosphatase methylesterase 1 [Elasticomyces elasticus]